MGSSGKAFDEVKAILGKLDRSIDQARSKRLGPDEEPAEASTSENTADSSDQLIGVPNSRPTPKASERHPIPNEAPQRRGTGSEFGRARPLRAGEAAPANPTGQWDKAEKAKAKPAPIDDDELIG